MPDPDIAAAFGGLYAACGLPAPAVRQEADERSYRRTAEILSGGSDSEAWASAIASYVMLNVSCLLLLPFIGPFVDGGHVRATDTAFYFVAFAMSVALSFVTRRMESRMGMRPVYLARSHGLRQLGSTPSALVRALSSALSGHAVAGHATPAASRFLDSCFRLGRRRVLEAAPDPRLGALSGGTPPGEGAPGILRLAAAAGALVEEAVLMDGFVLALVPGCLPPPRISLTPEPDPVRLEFDFARLSSPDPVLMRIANIALDHHPRDAEPMLRRLGIDDCVAALSLDPRAEDEAGRLYSFRNGLRLVRVRDEVAGPDRAPLVHWISVPPHVLTPREGVAWSFGIPEAAYAPTAQS